MPARSIVSAALAALLIALPAGVLAYQASGIFPAGTWPAKDRNFQAEWYGKQLRAMHEPSLWGASALNGVDGRDRLLILPSFRPAVAIRIDRHKARAAVAEITILDGAGGYEPGVIAAHRSIPVPAEDLRVLDDAIAKAALWQQPTELDDAPDANGNIKICLDGTQLVFEHAAAGHHHLVTRHLQCDANPMLDAVFAAWIATANLQPTDRGGYRLP